MMGIIGNQSSGSPPLTAAWGKEQAWGYTTHLILIQSGVTLLL